MKTLLSATLVAAAFAASIASADTLGERMASGNMSYAAFQQLVAGAGVSEGEARDMTVSEVAALKWQDD